MPAAPGQKMIGAYLEAELAERFAAWARQTDGGTSAALRRLVAEAVAGRSPPTPAGVGIGQQVGIRLKPTERLALTEAARLRGTTPANWIRSLALVHLARRPQWNEAELDLLRQVFRELRRIGHNVNQIARAMNEARASGYFPPDGTRVVEETGERIRSEMRRVVAVMTGNFDYWGLPDAERPKAAAGAIEQARAQAQSAQAARQRRPRRRPARFREEEG